MRILRIRYALLILFFYSLTTVYGQLTIQGKVTDSLTNEALIGANVTIAGTSLGAATDIYGDYKIPNVPNKESIKLKVSYIGYFPREINIPTNSQKLIKLDIQLSLAVIGGKEVVVYGQAVGQRAAINQQITSNTIMNVISEEKIQELPDANAAEAIGRLPGVSIQRSGGEANQVVMRGMSAKYSTVTVDGIKIAPTDENSRGVDLSTISQGSLAGIELYKALTPDKDADAIAGAVNLVTKKAPSERQLKFDMKGIYSKMEESYSQYDFQFKYGERFFNDLLGVQAAGNFERRDRSNEKIDVNYTYLGQFRQKYNISVLTLDYINEIRKRGGGSILIDINTPDNGNIKFNNIFNSTSRNFVDFNRNFPLDGTPVFYMARDREQNIKTFNHSIRGENYWNDTPLGLDFMFNWGFSFAQSETKNPYDYSMYIRENVIESGPESDYSGMKLKGMPESVKTGPIENIIPYAYNNTHAAYLDTAIHRWERNLDIEKTAYLDISTKYTLADLFAGEFKFGGKYRWKMRYKQAEQEYALYSLRTIQSFMYIKNPDGSISPKSYEGTRFADIQTDNGLALFTNFINAPSESRSLFSKYNLYPMISRDALKKWYDYNKYGCNSLGTENEFYSDLESHADYYDVTERVSAGYMMNTLNYGTLATLIMGIRFEAENNDYISRFSRGALTGMIGKLTGDLEDTTAHHDEIVWLPNVNAIIRPTDFMNIRLAAYKALARPDFNLRIEKFVVRNSGTSGVLNIGNSRLLAAKAWNFEANTSFFGNEIGLITVSAFYKEIKDMQHFINRLVLNDAKVMDSLGIPWKFPSGITPPYTLIYTYNSDKPTKVWGFEFEHQANLTFLPGLLKNIVISYNLSVIRSETFVAYSKRDSIKQSAGGITVWKPFNRLSERKDKLEGQPELFGNIAVGYDIGGFSARLSLFYQDEYAISHSIDANSDRHQGEYSRLDLTLKYEYDPRLSFFMNFNNLTNTVEKTYLVSKDFNWKLLDTSERYGFTADLGVRVTL